MDKLGAVMRNDDVRPLVAAARLASADIVKLSGLILVAAVVLLPLYLVYRTFVYPSFFSPYRHVPGPSRSSWMYGSLPELLEAEPGVQHTRWVRAHGGLVRYMAFFGEERILLADPAALNHVLLANAYDYPKPNEVRGNLSRLLGKGVLFAEGDDHKRQRRILNPSFAPAHLRDLLPSFYRAAHLLRDSWDALVDAHTTEPEALRRVAEPTEGTSESDAKDESEERDATVKTAEEGTALVEVLRWFSRATLDIIGDAGFNYHFSALQADPAATKLGSVMSNLFSSTARQTRAPRVLTQRLMGKIINAVPMAERLPLKRIQEIRAAFGTMEEESRKILQERRDEVQSANEKGEKHRDLISILLRSTMSDAKSRMSDMELQGQMTTFILAGHETTSTFLTWTLYRLATNLEVQRKLRDEIHAARRRATEHNGDDELGADDLMALPYLDAVVREVGRLDPPVASTVRMCTNDDVLPLSQPFTTPDGKTHDSMAIKKGQGIFISIAAYNSSPAIFGDDAHVFRPERWAELDARKATDNVQTTGVWSPLLTFLAGPRSCIGYKFALLELKAVLSVIVDRFTFALRDDEMQIERRAGLVSRPLIKGEEDQGFRLPLVITRVQGE